MFSDTTGEALWSITQITDATLSMTSETADVTDAIGNVITQFDRSKNAEFSGSNALWDLGLSAAQFGSEKVVASEENKIVAPIYEQLKVDNDHNVTLSHEPKNEIKYIYILNTDSTLGEKYQLGASSAEGNNFTVQSNRINVPQDIPVGTNIAVFYDYETSSGVMLQNNASEFPKAGKFMLEVIGKDTCDKTAIYVAYLVFPNAKLKTDMDLSFTSDGGHPFSLQMMQDYCDLEKRLFNIYVDESVPTTPTKPMNKEPITPSQSTVISDLGGKKISDLITSDAMIDEDGKATGTTHYIDHWTEFSTDDSQNSGNFFPIQLPAEWEGKKVKLHGSKNGDKTITVDPDLLLIQRLENLVSEGGGTLNQLTMTLEESEPISQVRSGKFIKKIGAEAGGSKTLNFGAVRKEECPVGEKAFDASKTDYGNYGKNDIFYEGGSVDISWNGTTGKVRGTLKYHGDNDFDSENTGLKNGHYFFAFALNSWFNDSGSDKEVTVTGNNTRKAKATDWVMFIDENNKKKGITVQYQNTLIARFDLTDVVLAPKSVEPSENQ